MFASLLACVAMMPYWANGATFLGHAGIERPGQFLTFGQIAELFVLAFILPVFVKKFGIKWTMIIGISCWIVRYVPNYSVIMSARMKFANRWKYSFRLR